MKTLLHVGFGSLDKSSCLGFNNSDWNEIRFDINRDVNPDIVGTLTDILYGSRKDLEDGNHSRLHKCGFTYSALIGAFHQAGFKKWIGGRRPRKFDLYLIACKNKHSDNELNNLAYQFLP